MKTKTTLSGGWIHQTVRKADPCIMVIFGATGDLTRRKLLPALCNLALASLLTDHFAVIGFARQGLTTEAFRQQLTENIKEFATRTIPPDLWEWFRQRIYYVHGDGQDPKAFRQLKELIVQVDQEHVTQGNRLYHLAVAPKLYCEIVHQLASAGMTQETNGHWCRVIVEKPFGHDLDSARALNAELSRVLEERQIFRIDHYLGKETVQNIMIFRFANGIFEPIWNRRYIDHVQITAAEVIGIGSRAAYYDATGALRDMVPNHLFQLVSLTAMEPPISFLPDAVRNEQAKVLDAIQPPHPEEVLTLAVRGQYGEGYIDDEPVPGYRSEPNVPPNSNTETFVALKLRIDNWRWANVPFYLRTGKRLAKSGTEIAIQFKQAPLRLFRNTPVESLKPNELVIHIQPDEGVSLSFGAKVPGPIMQVGPVEMDFNYADYFGSTPDTGYERLIYDCMIGDATLFRRADMVEVAWSAIMPVLDLWKALPPRNFPNYPAGSWGPAEAEDLLNRDGRAWRRIA